MSEWDMTFVMCNYIWRMTQQANVAQASLNKETTVTLAFSTAHQDSNSELNITLVKETCTGKVVVVANIFIT